MFAAYTAYTDHEIGRVIQEVQDEGKLDNTLIIYIVGDNGTSAEGTLDGTYNQLTAYNGILKTSRGRCSCCITRTGARIRPTRTWRWHGRGRSIRRSSGPSRWPRTSAARGKAWPFPGPATSRMSAGIRTQFHHVIDIVPTILEATGIKAPEEVNGIKQKPIEGVSMVYTFDKANANAPSKRDTQYFEMVGNRAHLPRRLDGQHDSARPAVGAGNGQVARPDHRLPVGALQHRRGLFAVQRPRQRECRTSSRRCRRLFLTEAAKYNVFPLDNTGFARLADAAAERGRRANRVHLHG